MTDFLHGAEIINLIDGARTITTVASGIIGIIGTAPDSQPEVKAKLATGIVASNNAVTYTAKLTGSIGNKISLALIDPKANSQALAVTVSGRNISVSLATGSTGTITTTATQLMAAIAANTAANALIGTASTGASSGAGVVASLAKTALDGGIDEAFPVNTPVLVAGELKKAALLGTTGTLPDAIDSIFDQGGATLVVVRVDKGVDDAATTANVIGGVDSQTGKYKGVYAFLGAESTIGAKPKILIAPGFTHQRTTNANPVVAELIGIATRLGATIPVDGPSTTDDAAVTYSNDFGSERVYMVDPRVLKVDSNNEAQPAYTSAHVAGIMAVKPFWESPSNTVINGVVGVERPIDFTMGDKNSRANKLNASDIATVINLNGYRLWGNRTLSSEPRLAFLSVVRVRDMINDSILREHLWAIDRNITKTYLQDVVDGVNAYGRLLIAEGAILGFECWVDRELNTDEAIAAGEVYFDFKFTAASPAEHITFRSHLVNDFIETIFTN